jgi:hypothetical protein
MENIIIINCVTLERKEYLEDLLANGEIYLYQSFGFDIANDIYLDFVEIDLEVDPLVIYLKFEGENANIFCNELSIKFQVNIILSYFNKESNYSGKYSIRNGIIVCNVNYSYWYGLYLYNTEQFWETVNQLFDHFNSIETLISFNCLQDMDIKDLHQLNNSFVYFQNLKFLNNAFQKL